MVVVFPHSLAAGDDGRDPTKEPTHWRCRPPGDHRADGDRGGLQRPKVWESQWHQTGDVVGERLRVNHGRKMGDVGG